jgi:hypothetical protein
LVIYLSETDSYELLPQGGGEKKFADRPLEGGVTQHLILSTYFYCALNFKALISLSLWRSILMGLNVVAKHIMVT